MAYDAGGYAAQQRPYNGPAAGRPAPRQYGGDAPMPHGYGDSPRYQGYGGEYGNQESYGNYGQDAGYGPGPARGDMPAPQGRGAPPMGRPPPGDPPRGNAYPPRRGAGPPPGQPMSNGRGRGDPYGPGPDAAARRPPVNDQGYGQYPSRDESHIANGMSSMDLNGRPQPGRSSLESQRTHGDYGTPAPGQGRAPPPRGPPPRGYPDTRRGPAPGQAPGSGYDYGYDDGYGQQQHQQAPPRNDSGPPGRSRTMPIDDQRSNTVPPPQAENLPYNYPATRGPHPPQRPATATGSRPPPQRTYPDQQAPSKGLYSYEAPGYPNQSAVSITDVVDSYYEGTRHSNPEYGSYGQPQPKPNNQNYAPEPQSGRGSYEHPVQAAQEQPHRGAHQTAQLSHAAALAHVPEPQAAVFEMAGDTPSVPPMPPSNAYQQGYERPALSYDQMPARGPSAPPGPGRGPPPNNGYPANHGMARPGVAAPQRGNPDDLPSHPTPVRPGLISNSPMVNPNDRPPPVRNYGGIAQQKPQPQPQQPPTVQLPPRQYSVPAAPTSIDLQVAQEQAQAQAPVTTQELEQLRMTIKANPADQESALRLAKRLIEASDALIPNLPDPRARAKARDRYLMDAHKILKKLASNQNLEAMFTLADGLGKGLFGSDPDTKEAFTLYQSAAKLGHPAAAYRTAVCCEIGHEDGGGTRRDPLKAMQWYKRAATLGDTPALYKVGMILLKGLLGQQRNPREAVSWLKRAAERATEDNPHALHELGLLYQSAQPSDYIIRDEGYALSLFQQAGELGYKFSQYRMGCAYEYGLLGCPIDPRLSIVWYSRAAMQEEHQSELALSGWYLTGSEGVLNQSDTEAYLWARKAATAGLAKAEFAMGYFTEVGIGVPPNLEDAKRWYWRAAAQDFPRSRERLEELKRAGKTGAPPRQRERISRGRIERQQEGDCTIISRRVAIFSPREKTGPHNVTSTAYPDSNPITFSLRAHAHSTFPRFADEYISDSDSRYATEFTKDTINKREAGEKMAKQGTNWKLWSKVLVAGIAVSVGGPAFTYWISPSEEELRSRYNPDLLKRSIEGREERQQEFNEFVNKLKEYSKSDKPVWTVAKEDEERRKRATMDAAKAAQKEADARREEMRREAGLGKN